MVTVPHDTSAKEILEMDPDGIMLSNGPGDPAENTKEIAAIAGLPGGDLFVTVTERGVTLTGDSQKVFSGEFTY